MICEGVAPFGCLTVSLLLLVVAIFGDCACEPQPRTEVIDVELRCLQEHGPGWKLISGENLGLEGGIDHRVVEAPPNIVAANPRTQLAWILLDICEYDVRASSGVEAIATPSTWPKKVHVGPKHPFIKLVALGTDAVPACIERLRVETDLVIFRYEPAFLDLVLICALTGKDWRAVPVLEAPEVGIRHLPRPFQQGGTLPSFFDPPAGQRHAMVDHVLEAAAWVKWYDEGMKTPVPPLIQHQLERVEGFQERHK